MGPDRVPATGVRAMPDEGEALATITDPLTGAYSRALLMPRLTEELSRAARSSTGCAVFLFDVDYFKSVNDAYGHGRGDEVLCHLVERIHSLIRGYDVLFRHGGDEFLLLLPDTARADAVRVALRLAEGIRSTPFPGEPPLTVSVSLGVATFPHDATDPEGLIACADRRNYLAKQRGRACAVADDAVSDSRPVSSRLLERDIPLATAHQFLTRLVAEGRGALRVTGEPGAGHSRFLEEVSRAARLRGFTVADASAPPPVLPEDASGIVLVADRDRPVQATTMAWTDRTPESTVVGLVWSTLGAQDGPPGTGLPVLDSVELLAWSPAALRIWLRFALQGEPSPALVDWLATRAGGLPARAERELDRLTAGGNLIRSESGAWTVAPKLLARAHRRRPRLPESMTELIGRQGETAQVAQLLTQRRLVTLVGPGGIGKTRLSLAVAGAVGDQFDDGAVFVPLAEATTPDLVVAALARALELVPSPGQPLVDAVREHLADSSALIVLDNFEQVRTAAPVVKDLLATAPGVRVLASSRERLGIYGEQVYPVPPLALPEPDRLGTGPDQVARALAASPALALFNSRARATVFDFALTAQDLPTVIALCRRLDGLPLAIELAASRADAHTPAEMLSQLDGHLDLPGDGPYDVPDRQRTIRGAIDWSVALLDTAERGLLARLGAFTGGCRLDAVAALSDPGDGPDDALAKRLAVLVDKSLVRAEPDAEGDTRYVMLETIRSYSVDMLTTHESTVYSKHAEHFASFAGLAGAGLTGPHQARWLGRIDREYQNLRAAFRRSIADGHPVTAARIGIGLWRFWRTGNRIDEGRGWLGELLDGPLPDPVRARVLHAAAVLAAAQDNHQTAHALATESMRLARAADDAPTAAAACNALGISALAAGDLDAARGYFEQSLGLWEADGTPFGMAIAHGNLTKVALRSGDLDTAADHAGRCLALERRQGNIRGIMLGVLCLGEIGLAREEVTVARTHLAEALTLSRDLGDVFGEAMALHLLGRVAQRSGDTRRALELVGTAVSLRRDIGDREDLAVSLETLGCLLADGSPELAARLLGAAEALRDRHLLPPPTEGLAERSAALALLRSTSGEAALTAAWANGGTGSLDSVIDDALGHLGRPIA